MKPWAKQTGFTIVELLIVIVVIGILAAITIVAYNGIQDRARKSALQSSLTQTEKEIMAWALLKNGESVSLSNSLVGGQIGDGQADLLRSLTSSSDITMYGVYQVVDMNGNYYGFLELLPTSGTQMFWMGTGPTASNSLGTRIDTSSQTNVSTYQTNVRNAGTKVIGWLQVSNGATSRSFGFNQSAAYNTSALTAHAGWNFSRVKVTTAPTGNGLAALVFDKAHDAITRTQIMGWLAEKYNVPISL